MKMKIALSLLATLALAACVSHGRLLEPGRSHLMLQGIMSGMPATAVLCVESRVVKAGAKRVEDITPGMLKKALRDCQELLGEELNREMEEEMIRQENLESAQEAIPENRKV